MYEKIATLRSFLKRNKIFLDVIVAFFLTLMTITVSINANKISQNQNDLMKEENQPFFRFNFTENYKDKYNISDKGETLQIYNDGKPSYMFSAKQYAVLEISLYSGDGKYSVEEKHACIPIYSYFDFTNMTNSHTGLLITLWGHNPSDVFYGNGTIIVDRSNISTIINNINDDFSNYVDKQSNHKESGDVLLYTYMRITYLDIYGEEHDDIYWVNDQGMGKLCDEDRAILKRIYSEKDVNSYISIPYFKYISPKGIIKYLSESSSAFDQVPGYAWNVGYYDAYDL